ncbi:uncharacterized protein N7515_005670 [Penicillium bovifimosum]|uniref:Uncharacterized protein n=1 Tax=Penicillium bovifimosum TaxID=126998 RepID=A0A9W9GTG6_9EURO|nr:uncharacterized protein N7515_005670 [Penicillium bovifimosum]KAJ5129631.1 hypothetical protein N7515_005670 [Penicillium bovifimosum]
MSNPPPSHPMATETAGGSLASALCPWRRSSGVLREVADLEATWLTVELEEGMIYLDDESLLRFVLTQIRSANAVVDIRAQHYIRPRCLSIPSKVISGSYASIQGEACRLLMWRIEQVRTGEAWLDRDVLFGPRRWLK